MDPKGEQMGHYRLVTGYDDATDEWILYDSLESRGVSADEPYRGVRLSYEQFARWWAVMNRRYLVVYPPEQVSIVESIIGKDLDDDVMWAKSLEVARQDLAQRPEDAFAWFTLGTNLLHNDLAHEAAEAYDRARVIGLPYRMMWYQFGAFEAYYRVGRYDEVIALADGTLAVTADVEELHYWKGRALEALGDIEGARACYKEALRRKSNDAEAAQALADLE
jgi:tetratricopeptide (TPR) repeat protein